MLQKGKIITCTCLLESEAPPDRYAVREVTLDSEQVVVFVSEKALSPKAASPEQLGKKIRSLIADAESGPVSCGETGRSFTKGELESWLNWVDNEPVLKIIIEKMTIRDVLTDAIRYWEVRRVAYNAILALVVVVVFLLHWPGSRLALSADLVQTLFILAVLANVAYCAAYVVDVVAQYSGFQAIWKRHRWLLFVLGTVFASIIAKFFAIGMFGHAA